MEASIRWVADGCTGVMYAKIEMIASYVAINDMYVGLTKQDAVQLHQAQIDQLYIIIVTTTMRLQP